MKPAAQVAAIGSPTWSLEAEQQVLGALMTDAEAAQLVEATGLAGADFHDQRHGEVWAAIRRLRQDAQTVDIVTVFEQLQSAGSADRCGGLQYLSALCAGVASARNAGVHAAIVVEKARRRRIEAIGDGITRSADNPARIEALLQDLGRIVAPKAAPAGAIPLEWAADLPDELQAPPQIVEGVLTAGGMSMFFGESNSGKSYLALHLAVCVSLGLPWLGRRTQRGAVLYVAAEGAWSIRLRLAAYRKHHGRSVGAFGLIPCALSLVDPSADVEALIELIKAEAAKLPEPIGLVVVDTVARVMAGGDENAGQDMGRLVGAADRIREETGAHMLYIHHAGKDSSRGARGHSSLRAALDTEIEVTADASTKTHTAKVTKQRDLPSKGETFAARFVPVELGFDQWGGAITACAVVETEAATGSGERRRFKGAEQAVLAFLAGKAVGIRRAEIVAVLESQGNSRSAIYAAIKELLLAGLVTDTNGMIYAPKV